jgi:hypothetical protein
MKRQPVWLAALLAAVSIACGAGQTSDPLVEGFEAPPQAARPRVWWHWIDGNITKEGIRKDLQWMQRMGIGGLQNFDGAFGLPQVVEKRLIYMTPEWQGAFRYATELADHLGLELAIASSPGWSETGGPWVRSEDGMKKLVWSVTSLSGARHFKRKLPQPPAVPGPFQEIPNTDALSLKEADGPHFYRDAAVIAYRTPRASRQDPRPVKVSSSATSLDGTILFDGDIVKSIALPISEDRPAWVLFDYGVARRFRAASLARPAQYCIECSFSWVIEASDDGKAFRPLTELPNSFANLHTTVSFPAVTARFMRLVIRPKRLVMSWVPYANSPGAQSAPLLSGSAGEAKLTELQFFAGARVHRFEEKAGFTVAADYSSIESDASSPGEAVDPGDVIDVTRNLTLDGTLDWNPPAGEWTVLRLGYSLTGKTNHPATAAATGLEVDKLDRRAVKAYLDTYLGQFERTVGAKMMGQRGIRAFLTDSIESAGQNWTPAMIGEFKARRGYDPTAWLPALTGIIVGDAARTDRFLWDFRKTLQELISDVHYAQVADSARRRGIIYYGESLEGYPTQALGDDLDMRQYADIPMGAIWTNYQPVVQDGLLNNIADILGAASVSHVLGKDGVAAESLTSCYEPWAFSPASLRPVIDLAFALGVNRPVIHTSVHQPLEQKPGLTLGPCGQHFTRQETWGEMARPWITYLSRNAFLLQQGTFAADVAWFYGEDGPLAGLYKDSPPSGLPAGYGFDFINANFLLNHLKAQAGRLICPSGTSYRLLYLGGSSTRMTLPVLRRLKELAAEGIAIAGQRPVGSPSLADDGKANEEEYRRLVAELWDSGQVIANADPNAVLQRLGIERDFDYRAAIPNARILFLHRKLAEGDLYFLTNRQARPERIEARFRVTGRKPELWLADTGQREAVPWRIENGQTVVRLDLYANQSLFIVFREAMDKREEQLPLREHRIIARLDGDWQLSFETGRGAPSQVVTGKLGSWAKSRDAGIQYFSGIGTYRKTFRLRPVDLEGDMRASIDLGEVYELAEVTINGKPLGTAWHSPFRLDVTGALKPGVNKLEIRVANLWVNRLIGDQQPGAVPVAFTLTPTYKADAPLRPSGLLGPVILSTKF